MAEQEIRRTYDSARVVGTSPRVVERRGREPDGLAQRVAALEAALADPLHGWVAVQVARGKSSAFPVVWVPDGPGNLVARIIDADAGKTLPIPKSTGTVGWALERSAGQPGGIERAKLAMEAARTIERAAKAKADKLAAEQAAKQAAIDKAAALEKAIRDSHDARGRINVAHALRTLANQNGESA